MMMRVGMMAMVMVKVMMNDDAIDDKGSIDEIRI